MAATAHRSCYNLQYLQTAYNLQYIEDSSIVAWQLLQSTVHFSHTYCIQICALLVPFNLLVTLATMALVAVEAPTHQVKKVAYGAIGLAIIMILHVLSWLLVGVVMIPTYVLFSLAMVCIGINGLALSYRPKLRQVILTIARYLQTFSQKSTTYNH